ncbi:MAG: hypothetical protein QG604_825 [Candidatus Dependentiae bacterium]|nr:hypothetical protein [Candidatus Dependentiae bacterium]
MPLLFSGLKVVAALAGFGAAYQYIDTKLDRQTHPPIGTLVDIGGYKLHLVDQGTGGPTVILDAAMGCSSIDWALVQPEIAPFARVISYDRAGYDWSDKSPLPRTSATMAIELHTLLSTAHIPGPYILVGHSMGGINMRWYAHFYPNEVAGLILVESPHEEQIENLPLPSSLLMHSLRVSTYLGLPRLFFKHILPTQEFIKAYPPEIRSISLAQKCQTKSIETFIKECMSIAKSYTQLHHTEHSLGALPLTVITAKNPLTTPVIGGHCAQKSLDFVNKERERLQKQLVTLSTRGTQIIAEHSGHQVPQDQPEIIIKAIRDMIAEINNKAKEAIQELET